MIGGTLKGKKKEWMNPYGKRRGVLFFFIFIALVAVGADWGNSSMAIFPLGVVIGKVIRFLLIYPALIYAGMGRRKLILLPSIVFLVSTVLSVLFLIATGLSEFMALIFLNGLATIFGFLSFFKYR